MASPQKPSLEVRIAALTMHIDDPQLAAEIRSYCTRAGIETIHSFAAQSPESVRAALSTQAFENAQRVLEVAYHVQFGSREVASNTSPQQTALSSILSYQNTSGKSTPIEHLTTISNNFDMACEAYLTLANRGILYLEHLPFANKEELERSMSVEAYQLITPFFTQQNQTALLLNQAEQKRKAESDFSLKNKEIEKPVPSAPPPSIFESLPLSSIIMYSNYAKAKKKAR